MTHVSFKANRAMRKPKEPAMSVLNRPAILLLAALAPLGAAFAANPGGYTTSSRSPPVISIRRAATRS